MSNGDDAMWKQAFEQAKNSPVDMTILTVLAGVKQWMEAKEEDCNKHKKITYRLKDQETKRQGAYAILVILGGILGVIGHWIVSLLK